MTMTITTIGNSQGLLFDAAMMDLARLRTPKQAATTAKRLIRKNAELFRRLS